MSQNIICKRKLLRLYSTLSLESKDSLNSNFTTWRFTTYCFKNLPMKDMENCS